MPYTEVNGERCFYNGAVQEDGLPLILIHGSGGNCRHWIHQSNASGAMFNPLAVDLPGHGRSEGTPSDSVAVYRDWVRAFTHSLKLTNFVLAGHSLGGAIALDYALQYPEDLIALVLVGSGARLRVAPVILESLRAGQHPAGMVEHSYGPLADEQLLKRAGREAASIAPDLFLADLTACDRFDVMNRLAQIKLPALIVCGTEDRLTPLKYSRFLEQSLPWSEIVEIEGAGHMVMLEAPDALNRALAKFTNKLIPL